MDFGGFGIFLFVITNTGYIRVLDMVRGERREDKYICVIYKMIDGYDYDYDCVFSYQGAFGPPTYGHYKSMEAFANQLNIDFIGKKY